MQNSKLYSILEYFDKYEQNRLRKFLVSPYFNKNEAIISLFEGLIVHINSGSNHDLDKTDLWNEINKSAGFDDVLYRKYCSDLLKLVESYLAQQVYESNPIHKANFLIESVGNRKMDKLFKSSIRTARRLSDHQLYRTTDYYLGQYQLERNLYDLEELGHDRTAKKNVEAILNNLDRFYLSEKLRYSCTALSQQVLVSLEYKLLFIDEILEHINKYKYEDVPPIAVYYQIYLTNAESENTDHYFKLMEILEIFGDLFPKEEAEFIYGFALNYCIKKINQGNQKFLEKYFNVFVILLDKELIINDGELSPWHFRNIVVAALRLGKYDWTENFINFYQRYLPVNMRENAVSFNTAQLYFSQKQFEKVMELLRNVEYEDFTYNLNSKTMLLSTYYETDEIEPLYSLMDSFRTYLNRHKDLSPSKRKPYLNFIRLTKKLSKLMPGDSKGLNKLKQEIELEKGNVSSLSWLKEKITELE